ncbi:MAG: ATP-binding protein, partial [Planctomycetota bacterium]
MPAGDESPAALGACLRDMVVLLALPSMCHGQSPREVLEIVAEVAAEMLHLDLVYVRLGSSPDAAEAIRMRARPDAREHLGVIRRAIAPLLEPHASDRARLEAPLGGPDLNVLIAPVGFYSDGACIVLGASRATFPSPLEVVLLRATASLAGAAIENAKLLQISRDADRRKDEFLALLGHELRNPLAPILTALQLLELKRVGGEKERAIIERQVQHMIQLVNDLLDISRVTKGKLQLNGEPTQISGVVQRALELASPAIEAKRHSVSVDVAPRLRVHGDPLRLAQVFGNLLTNAAKFTEPGGRIELRGRREGSRVVLSVRDSGRGIDPAMQERIFEPFVQAD